MASIKLEQFRGIIPRTDRKLLGLENSQEAKNCDLLSGKIRPVKEPKDLLTLPDANRKTIFPFNNTFISFTTDVDIVRTPIDADLFSRIYYTGSGNPKVRGLVSDVDTELDLGLPAPTEKPTTSNQAKSTSSYTRAWGFFYEETNGSQVDLGTLSEDDIEITEVTASSEYSIVDRGTQTITAATNADPVQITTGTAHGLLTGERTAIKSVGGMTEINDRIFTVTRVDATNFTLDSEDGTGHGTYTTGGTNFPLGVPPRLTATSTSILILFFDATDIFGNDLGRLYPEISVYRNNSSFFLDGGEASGEQINIGDDGIQPDSVTFDIAYDSSTAVATGSVLDRSYVYTFVSVFGEEGPPSEASTLSRVDPDQNVLVSNMDISFSGNLNITKKRIYRTVTGTLGTRFQFVTEIDLGDATFLDGINDENTKEVLPSTGWIAPPTDLKGLVSMPGGFFAGFKSRSIYFSEPFQLHAWPAKFITSVDFDIVALGVTGNSLIIATEGFPYVATTVNPNSVTIARIPLNQSCVSKRSLTDAGNVIVYASPDGLVMIQGGTADIITDSFYTRKDWQAINPDTIIAEIHNRSYYFFSDNSSLILDLDNRGVAITENDETVTGLFSDIETDILHMIQLDKITQWEEGTNFKSANWKSKMFTFRKPMSFSAGRVIADAYPVTLKFYGDGVLVLTYSVTNNEAFRIPVLRPEKFWEIEVVATTEVEGLVVSTSMRDI